MIIILGTVFSIGVVLGGIILVRAVYKLNKDVQYIAAVLSEVIVEMQQPNVIQIPVEHIDNGTTH